MPNEEPLALLPGTLCDARVFSEVVRRLPPHPIIVPDLTGETTAAAMAARLLRELPPQFSVAGFSLGGIVALEMIAQAPDRIARIALIDTTARPDPESNWAVRRNAVARAASIGVDRYVSEKLWSLYVSGDARADAQKRQLVSSMSASLGLEAFRTQSEIAIHRADSRPRLAAITVPALVVCGEDDRLCPPEVHREIADGILGARLVVAPRAGHFALIEAPELVAREMATWLVARRPQDMH